jgi:hypothetical protein
VDIAQILRCLRGKHEHASRVSRDENDVVRSRCKGCGKRMVRIEDGRHKTWQVDKSR